jgi:hypothetical protein
MKRLPTLFALAASFLAAAPAGADPFRLEPFRVEPFHAQAFRPMQAVSGEFSGRHVLAYFVKAADACKLTLMIDAAAAPASRLQISVDAGAQAALDSADGKTLRFGCAAGAMTMTLAYLERLAAAGSR